MEDQGKIKLRILLSFIVVLSAILLVSDDLIIKNFDIKFKNNFGFSSSQNLIYNVSQSISGIIIVASIFIKVKPYRISYLFIFYIQCLQLYWVFFHVTNTSYEYFSFSVIGLTLLFALLIVVINRAVKDNEHKNQKIDYLKSMLDLQLILRNKTI
ncbi:hypothetical protein BWK59_14795 [Flavobacterium davisii]|uniref:Uncharacterized protein n=1 Tax=Flavobacterium davisii TaxID=2906077 RepID=A0A246GEV8_9FLAO|nr:hypothetical protein [Flavobacterium davisii]OWP82641.1 hypothetical protein BWK59_14795 [Flavobacterium davisii]